MTQQFLNLYLGQPANKIGTNGGDIGECLGLWNRENFDRGLGYAINGADFARQLPYVRNLRPDVLEWVPNNPNDLSQLPPIGAWVVWGGNNTFGEPRGHVAKVTDRNSNSMLVFEQFHNVAPRLFNRNYVGVLGWFTYKGESEVIISDAEYQTLRNGFNNYDGVVKQLNDANAMIASLSSTLTNERVAEAAEDVVQNKTISDVTARAETAEKKLAEVPAIIPGKPPVVEPTKPAEPKKPNVFWQSVAKILVAWKNRKAK